MAMDRASALSRVATDGTFRDPLGERWTVAAPDGRPRTLLRIPPALATAGAFEFALRERVARLSAFEHPDFVAVRGVERLTDEQATLGVWTDHVDGVRLSELLIRSVQRGLHFDLNAALAVLRQIVPALAALHEALPDVAHGTLGPERLIVGPLGRVFVTDYVLGSAVEQLRYSQRKYWRDLRVAVPRPSGHPKVDQRADVTQLGVVALSLILGRPLRDDEYPTRVGDVVAAAWAVSSRGGFEPLPTGLRGWLGRALQLDARNSFANAIDACAELHRVLPEGGDALSRASFEAFLASHEARGLVRPESSATTSSRRVQTASPLPHHPKVMSTSAPARGAVAPARPEIASVAHEDEAGRLDEALVPTTHVPLPAMVPVLAASPSSLDLFDSESSIEVRAESRSEALSAAPSVAAGAATPSAREAQRDERLESIPKPAALKAPLARQTLAPKSQIEPSEHHHDPSSKHVTALWAASSKGGERRSGAASAIEPQPSVPTSRERRRPSERRSGGRWPLLHTTPGSPGVWRGMRVVGFGLVLGAIVAGSVAAGRRIGAARPEPHATTGTVHVQSNPPGARVVVDGQPQGETPVTVSLAPGAHAIELSNDAQVRLVAVEVAAGKETSHYIELPAPGPAVEPQRPHATAEQVPVKLGRLDVSSDPPGVAISVDGVPRGETPTTVGDLAPGEHVLVASRPDGELRRVVSIEPGATQKLVLSVGTPQTEPPRPVAEPGWVVVTAPIEMTVRENGRDLGKSGSERIALAPGRHVLELANDALGYGVRRTLQIRAGKLETVRLVVPTGSLAVNASPWADVWVDGHLVGQTPLSNISVAIGRHDITLRHPDLGERRQQVIVGAGEPARVTLDLERP